MNFVETQKKVPNRTLVRLQGGGLWLRKRGMAAFEPTYSVESLGDPTNWRLQAHVPVTQPNRLASVLFRSGRQPGGDGFEPLYYIGMSTIPGARYGLFASRDLYFQQSTVRARKAGLGFYYGIPIGRVNHDPVQATVDRYVYLHGGYIHQQNGVYIQGTSPMIYINTALGTPFENNARLLANGTVVCTRTRLMRDEEILVPYGRAFWRPPPVIDITGEDHEDYGESHLLGSASFPIRLE